MTARPLTVREKLRGALPQLASFEHYWRRRRQPTAPIAAMSTAGYYYMTGYLAGRKAERRK